MNQFSPYDEKLILLRIADGDEKAFRAFFNHYRDRFYAVVLKMTRSDAVAEEIVQETFFSIWQKRELLREVEKPESYFFTAVYRRVYRHYKKLALDRKAAAHIADTWGAGEEEGDAILFQESQRLVEEAIRQLPQQQQLVFRLSRQQGLNRDQIAAQLNISPNTVRNHMADAIKSVRAYLKRAALLMFWSL